MLSTDPSSSLQSLLGSWRPSTSTKNAADDGMPRCFSTSAMEEPDGISICALALSLPGGRYSRNVAKSLTSTFNWRSPVFASGPAVNLVVPDVPAPNAAYQRIQPRRGSAGLPIHCSLVLS